MGGKSVKTGFQTNECEKKLQYSIMTDRMSECVRENDVKRLHGKSAD